MKRRHLGVALVAMAFLSEAMLSGFDDRTDAGQAGALGVGGALSDVDYSLDVRMLTVPLTLDWYPFADAFHLSAGIIVNQTKMDLNVRPSAMFDTGGMTYSAAEAGQLRSNATCNPIAPYLGLGWGHAFGREKRWGLLTDVGVAFLGRSHVSLHAADPTSSSNLPEEQDSIRQDSGRIRFNPVISVGLFFRF
jgi:hypothetical protein